MTNDNQTTTPSRRRQRSTPCTDANQCHPNRKRSSTARATFLMSLMTLLHSPSDAFMMPSASSPSAPLHASTLDGTSTCTPSKPTPRTKVLTKRSTKSKSLLVVAPRSRSRNNNNNNINHSRTNNESEQPQHLPRLTHEQEMSLLHQMRSHPADSPPSQMARQTLLLHNLPLVKSIVTKTLRSRPHLRQMMERSGAVSKFTNTGVAATLSLGSSTESRVGAALTRDDLLHEGTIGLAEALDRYDFTYSNVVAAPEEEDVGESGSSAKASSFAMDGDVAPKGARLGTYATYWIRARILRAIQNREHAFRFPEHTLQASHRLVKAAKEMNIGWDIVEYLEDDKSMTASKASEEMKQRIQLRDTLCKAAGIASDSLFREAIRVRTVCKSGLPTPLESWMKPSPNSAERQQLEEEELMSEADPQHVRDTLSKYLDSREVQVLSLRYGLVSPEEEEGSMKGDQKQVFRDYEAEVEEELFGPSGVLSHYSTVPADVKYEPISSVPISPLVNVRTNNKAAAKASPSKAKSSSSPNKAKANAMAGFPSSALVSYKEIGKQMTLSSEYCRRLCNAAMQKLAQAAEEGRLAESDFLLGW